MGDMTNLRSTHRTGQPGETEELIPYDFTMLRYFSMSVDNNRFFPYIYVHLKYDK